MISFAYWDATQDAPPRQAELVSLWHRQCLALGLTPRLLTARDAVKSNAYKKAVKIGLVPPSFLPDYALAHVKGKYLFELPTLNHRL